MQMTFGIRPALLLATIGKNNPFVIPRRFVRHQAFDAAFSQDELTEAREWYQSFRPASLPQGSTSYSRSSGPGGQHVNKTETKATTTWSVSQLMGILPKLLHRGLRSCKYYSKRNDSISIQAQAERSRSANKEDNHHKLYLEIQNLYRSTVPGETSPEKARKYEALKKSANETRIKLKKQHGSKKHFRRGPTEQ